MTSQLNFSQLRAVDANGDPVSGARALFYVPGTTTPITVYLDQGATTPTASPLIANSAGVFPQVFTAVPAKVLVTTPEGGTLPGYPLDPAFLAPVSDAGAALVSFTPTVEIPETTVQAAVERVQANYEAATEAATEADARARGLPATAGTQPAYTLVSDAPAAALAAGQVYSFRIHAANTGAVTLNLDGHGVKDVQRYDNAGTLAALASGMLVRGAAHRVIYDGTRFVLLTPPALPQAAAENPASAEQGTVAGQVLAQIARKTGVASIATTSGTAHGFTGIPAGVREVVLQIDGVSLSGTDSLIVQLGDSGGYATTGYISASSGIVSNVGFGTATSTSGLIIRLADDGIAVTGEMRLSRVGASNRWVSSCTAGSTVGPYCAHGGGGVTLSGELDRIQVTRTGTDTFDAGAVSVIYK